MNNIPVRVRWFGGRQDGGTLIDPALGFDSMLIRASTHLAFCRPTAITVKDNVLLLSISNVNCAAVTQKATKKSHLYPMHAPHSSKPYVSSQVFLSGVCAVLSRFGVVVCMINTSEGHASVVIEGGLPRTVLERVVEGLKHYGEVVVHHDMAILTVISRGLSRTVSGPTSPSEAWGIAGKVFSTLVKADIGVEVIGRVGDVGVGCVVDEVDATRALWLAHRCCFASEEGDGRRGGRLRLS